MYGKESVENKIPLKGVESEEGCVMNMNVLRHEFKGGCNSDIRFCWEWRWGWGLILVG